jgi:hypothetical protein
MSESQKRFYTEQEIIDEIDRAQALAKKHMLNAETYEMEIRALQLRANQSESWMIEEKAKMAKHSRKLATALLDVRCKWLGEKLAEFRTLMLPIIDDKDTSIPKKKGVPYR